MGNKLCPKIILEGTRLTKKTDIAFKLNEHPKIVGPKKYRYHSPVISAEWCAFTNFPWGRGLINFNLEEEQKAMETYATWVKLFELQKYYSWIIDRFHISTQMYQSIYNNRYYDFKWLEEKLYNLGFRIIFCYRRPDTFTEAREERIKISGNPKQYDNLDIFIKEQEVINNLLDKSVIPFLKLDITDYNLDQLADIIANYMEKTEALYCNY
jgi:hypothetical protein